jgi:hypothetical protein
MRFTGRLHERKTRYAMTVAQAESYGIAAGPIPRRRDPDPRLVGQDVRRILDDGRWRDRLERLALVDLVLGQVSRPADERIPIDGGPEAKYAFRARVFADEAESLLRRKGPRSLKGKTPRVLVVGATAGISRALVGRGFQVAATDLWSEVVGRELGGVRVQNGATANARLLRAADLAIITGMTLANSTLPGLMRLAQQHKTSTLIWAITGRNFGDHYTEHGVDCVISDPSPFLLLPFPMMMAIWRRRR